MKSSDSAGSAPSGGAFYARARSRRPLVIVGDGEFAEIACEYFGRDAQRQVVGFCVERQYLTRHELCGLPVSAVEEMAVRYPSVDHDAFVAVTNTAFNRVRTRLYREVKERGYSVASYVSSRAFVWHNVQIGENCFVFEHNVLQYHVKLGNNVVLWSGNHIGHRTIIGDNCFITSHVVISGYCDIGENCVVGVNACVADKTTIGKDCLIGMGAVVVKPVPAGSAVVGNPAKSMGRSSYEVLRVPAPEA